MKSLTVVIVVFFLGLFVFANATFVVDQTEQALILQFGKPVRVVNEPGLKFKTPFIQNVEFFDKRLLAFDADSKEVTAADQKRLEVDAFVRYRITDPLLFKQTVASEFNMRSRLNTILESSLRQVIGRVPLAHVISEERATIMDKIRTLVNAQASGAQLDENGTLVHGKSKGFGIEVVDVRIRRADLPKENSESIYKRMQTERDREAKEFRAKGSEDAQKIRSQADKDRTIILAEARKTAEITRGEGDATATKLFAESFGKDEDFFQFYRTLQAYKKTLSDKDTTMVLTPNGEFLKYLEKGGSPAR
jgi:modulator of FtsH protease HflC